MNDLISIIMSTYKTDKEYLDAAIESILTQTYENIEFIIVCDGDNDEYNYIKNKYEDKRIKLLLNKENKGLPFSLNFAIKNSNGKYIARMDSDDIATKNRLEIQKKYLDKHNNIEICGMFIKCFGENNSKISYKYIKPSELEIQMLYIPVLVHPTVMFRKTFFDKKIYYNEDFKTSQDYELWSRAVNSNNIAIIPEIGLNYRVHKSQAGQKKREQQITNTKKIHKYGVSKISLSETDALFLFKFLYGYENMSKKNYLQVSSLIDKLIETNTYFNKKELKKILYNRYMIQMIKSKLFIKLIDFKVIYKIINYENFKYIIWKLFS